MPYRLAIALYLICCRCFVTCKNRLYTIVLILASTFLKKFFCLIFAVRSGTDSTEDGMSSVPDRIRPPFTAYGSDAVRQSRALCARLCRNRSESLSASFSAVIPQTSDRRRSGTASLPCQRASPARRQAFSAPPWPASHDPYRRTPEPFRLPWRKPEPQSPAGW